MPFVATDDYSSHYTEVFYNYQHESLVFVDSVDRGLILQYPFYHGMHNLRNRGREDITNDVYSSEAESDDTLAWQSTFAEQKIWLSTTSQLSG
eukprot:scaffold730_cov206-Alexandrium_tamarense.AAC.10